MCTTASLLLLASIFIPTQQIPDTSSYQGEVAATLPIGLSPGQLSSLANELLIDEPGDGRTWARGPQWKASFGPEGLVYTPFFGSDAPQNYPVQFDLSQVTLAGEALALDSRERSRSDHAVTLDRGAAREVYHLTKHTVEQTFVFDDLPANGELVLDIDVATDLAVEASGDGFRFWNELGEVHYGQATVIDARGRKLGLKQSLTSNGLQIVVPSHYVEMATFPITVDPILTTLTIEDNTRRQTDVDVAYDGQNSTYQIVFSERQSALDSDIITVNYNGPLNLLISASTIDITSNTWRLPSNASNYEEQQFLCVAIVGQATGSRRVFGRTRHAGTGARGPQFQISGPGAEAVDVGGKGNDIASVYDYMVVWQEVDSINQDFDIVAQAVEGDSTLTLGRMVIDGDVTDLDRAPSISKSSGRPGSVNTENEYMIVWEREISSTDHNIRGQVIEYTGSMTGHNQFNVYTFSDSLDPDVSTQRDVDTRNWLIVFERRIGSNYKIFAVIAEDGSAYNARNVQAMQNLDVDGDHRDPRIAYDSYDYLLAYQTTETNGDRSVYLTALNPDSQNNEIRTGLILRRESLGHSENGAAHLAIASHWDGGGPFGGNEPGDALAVWSEREDATGDSDIFGAIVTEIRSRLQGSQYCEAAVNSTGTSAWIWSTGGSFAGQFAENLFCMDMPPNSFGHFLVSNQPGFVVNPGGSQGNLCLQGSVGRFNRPGEIMNSGSDGFFRLIFDSRSLPSPTGSISVMAGENWYYQCWFRDVGPSSNFSNGIRVEYL